MEHPEIVLAAQQEFMSFEDFKHAMDEWAIADGFTSFYQKSDTGRRIVKCRLQNQYPFHVLAVWNEQRGCESSAAIYANHQAPIDFMPIYLRRTTCLEMYQQNLLLISLADLQQDIQERGRSSAAIT